MLVLLYTLSFLTFTFLVDHSCASDFWRFCVPLCERTLLLRRTPFILFISRVSVLGNYR